MARLDDFLAHMIKTEANSLQLRPGQPPSTMVGRESVPLSNQPLTSPMIQTVLEQVLDPSALQAFALHGQHDGSYEVSGLARFEFRARQQPDGVALAFRLADSDRVAVQLSRTPVPDQPTPMARSVELPPPPATPPPAAGSIDRSLSLAEPFRWRANSIRSLLLDTVHRQGSDLVVSCGSEARVRVAGSLVHITGAIFNDDEILASLGDALTDARREVLLREGNLDTALELQDGPSSVRFRVNVFHQMHGLAAAFRPIWDTVPSLEALNLPEELIPVVEHPYGLVLVTGPTGSGKSTTLSALLEHLNETVERHIITLEDPIEYVFQNRRSLVHQREVGVHVQTFAGGLRAALREAPDVIFVGEMRDLDTIASALTAAETGHLVLSTLHSGSAAQAIDRVIDVFPEHQQAQVRIQLADTLRAIVTQRLLPTADGSGRVPAIELVRMNYAFANLIRERRTHQFASQVQSSRREGTIPFDESVARLAKSGLIAREVAERVARDQKHLQILMGKQD